MEGKSSSGKAPLSVARVLQIIKVLSLSDAPLSLAELSRRLGTPKTSLIGLLRGLVDMDYVVFSDGTYRLGGSSFDLAGTVLAARQRSHMDDYIRAGMKSLNELTGETVLYGVLTGERPQMMTYIGMVESRGAIRISVGIGDRSPLYCTAGGRILLAGMTDDEVKAQLAEAPLKHITAQTETGKSRLLEYVRTAREEQFSSVADEMVQGITGIAAPVMDNSSRVLGALIVAGPTGRMNDDAAMLKSATIASARRISASLGHREAVAITP
ncbi:IclR family transcriptional regulator [Novosphingobium album (ex Hu et al. 2023)]|uniref:IclR family transcriptional regulator n=1 Tax=Novosphingobium album (ex Hu et al. 2023) TaxID=2930093 RepID=A0ABT0B873_9SPHN|nr:IclR family transcriptional regulator [Novosphingobium album (ex Hu et al. 2023)]MCJ2181051.1 IclR family transcriptional regulator [Novosphingobium album (ex Hu et al. 2023)]